MIDKSVERSGLRVRGMKNLEMETVKSEALFSGVIHTNVALLKFSGIILPGEKTLSNIILSYCLMFVSVTALGMQTFIYAYDFVIYFADIETLIESFALVVSFFGGLVRYLISYKWREKIQDTLNVLEDLWRNLNAEERHSVALCIKSTRNLTYFFISQCIFTIFFYAITPLIVRSPKDNDENATRILPYAFFVAVHHSPYYEILYFFQVFSMLNISFTCVGADMIGPIFITTLCGHFRVIQSRIQDLGRRKEPRQKNATVEASHRVDGNSFEVTKKLKNDSAKSLQFKDCINYHRIILAISTDIKIVTNVTFLVQLICSTYIISAVGFKLSGNDQDKYKYSSQIVLAIIQLLICNWPPDALLTESQAVADAVYLAPWYQWSTEFKKSVHIVILRAQKPVQLTAGKFVNLSLATFASMISSAVSFFTVLRSFN